jgi:hypothetical protein
MGAQGGFRQCHYPCVSWPNEKALEQSLRGQSSPEMPLLKFFTGNLFSGNKDPEA